VVPWGRSLDEYRKMFALTSEDLRGRILDCGVEPASFNVEATGAGHQVISCDPLYRLSADAIRRRVEETADTLLANVREYADRFVWRHVESPERGCVSYGSAPCTASSKTCPPASKGAATVRTRSPTSASPTARSTSPSAPTCSSSTPTHSP
jgi:hypothetical protein